MCVFFFSAASLTGSNFLSMIFFIIFKLLLKFLMYLMYHGLTGFDDEVDCNTLKYPQVKLLVLLSFLENHPQLLLHKILKCRKARFKVRNNVLLSSKPIIATFGNVLSFPVINSIVKSLGRQTLRDMMWGREAGTSLFVCTHRKHVAETVRQLVHIEQIEVLRCALAGTICKSSAQDAILKS